MIKEINKMNCPLTVYIVSGVDEDDGFKSRGILDVMVCYCLDLPCCSLSNIYSTSVRESEHTWKCPAEFQSIFDFFLLPVLCNVCNCIGLHD